MTIIATRNNFFGVLDALAYLYTFKNNGYSVVSFFDKMTYLKSTDYISAEKLAMLGVGFVKDTEKFYDNDKVMSITSDQTNYEFENAAVVEYDKSIAEFVIDNIRDNELVYGIRDFYNGKVTGEVMLYYYVYLHFRGDFKNRVSNTIDVIMNMSDKEKGYDVRKIVESGKLIHANICLRGAYYGEYEGLRCGSFVGTIDDYMFCLAKKEKEGLDVFFLIDAKIAQVHVIYGHGHKKILKPLLNIKKFHGINSSKISEEFSRFALSLKPK